MKKLWYLIPTGIFSYGLFGGILMKKFYIRTESNLAGGQVVSGGHAVILGLLCIVLSYLIYRIMRYAESGQDPKAYPFDFRFKALAICLGILFIASIVWQIIASYPG